MSPLRKAILDDTPNSVLAISSLSVTIDGVTDSDRFLCALEQCEVLNPMDIVSSKWWDIANNNDKYRFSLFAAVLADMPRALEIANTFIKCRPHQSVSELVKYVVEGITDRYFSVAGSLPSPKLLYATWYKKDCKLDTEAALCLRQSTFTNVLDIKVIRSKSYNKAPTSFIPRGNLIILSLCKADQDTFNDKFIQLLKQLLNKSIDTPKEQQSAGDALEFLSALVLNGRIGVAMNANVVTTPAGLLNLKLRVNSAPSLACKLKLKNTMTDMWQNEVEHMKVSSRNGKIAFIDALQGIVVTKTNPIVVLRSAAGDCFDLLLKVFDTTTKGVHYNFLDHKSAEEASEKTEQREYKQCLTLEDFPRAGMQAKFLDSIMKDTHLSYSFVYQATHKVIQSEVNHWVIAGRNETKGFLGPTWELYQALRGNFAFEQFPPTN